jgi:tetratricopeptide (TPR) repeat protein
MLPFYSTVPSAEAVPKARQAAEHALMLNPDLAEAHTTLAYALTVYYWDWAAAEREFRRATQLNPNYATAYKWYSDMLSAMGRFDEALASASRAAELDPRSPNVRTIVGMTRWFLGQEERALAEFDRALELDPTFPLTLMHSSRLYWVRGDTARFFATRERLDAVSERGEVPAAALRQAYAAGGPDSVLRLQVNSPGARRNPMDRARWHVLLGDLDAAFRDLDQAAEDRNVWLPFATRYPYLASLRADPRYAALLERMGLP